MFATPILLIIWRRPDCTRRVVERLQKIKPTRLYIACDGPSDTRDGEREKVLATRALVESMVDWPCEINKLYSATNLGCKRGPSQAISWFFENEEEGIILEDDCVPHLDFFPYCSELLERYRTDERIWCISGDNFQRGDWRGSGSYYFSRYTHIWGWATWRRCWRHFDLALTNWPEFEASDLATSIFEDPAERCYWATIWDRMHKTGEPDAWDYQWLYCCLSKGGLSILPNCNLVENIGYGQDATHTIQKKHDTSLAEKRLLPLIHPLFVVRDSRADAFTFNSVFDGNAIRRNHNRTRSRLWRVLRSCKKIIYRHKQ